MLGLVSVYALGCIMQLPKLVGWLSGVALVSINAVTLRRARLIVGWVIVCGWVKHLGM